MNGGNSKGRNGQMDAELEKLYFPSGRVIAEEEAGVDKIEEYGDIIEAVLMFGVHCKIAADEETVEASAQYIDGDDEEEYDEVNDDEIDEN